MEYQIIRSGRKTIALEITKEGAVLVRAPQRMARRYIDQFVKEHEDWIRTHLEKMRERQKKAQESLTEEQKQKDGILTGEEIQQLMCLAREDLSARAERYAPLVGVTYGRITIRHQKTRWGSCSSKGNLNFNCLLMLMPQEIRDYVVVHELAHRKEMNHSPAFWAIVERVLPDYRERRLWLRDHGYEYIQKMTG